MLKKINNLFIDYEKKDSKPENFEEKTTQDLINEALQSDVFTNTDDTIKIGTPITFEDAKYIAEVILSGRAVIVILDKANENDAQRILDFLMGVCFSESFLIERVAKDKLMWLINPNRKLEYRSILEVNEFNHFDEDEE